jgi:hypothetical protein
VNCKTGEGVDRIAEHITAGLLFDTYKPAPTRKKKAVRKRE